MWRLRNETLFAATPSFVRDRAGREVWIVAVKATYAIADDGSLSIHEEQDPVCIEPVHHGEPGASSLKFDSDVSPTKTGTDVVVVGDAIAPSGMADYVDVLLGVGPVKKTLRAWGDRVWERRGAGYSPSPPQPFATMPVQYERAFGGPADPRNPVGAGLIADGASPRDLPLPNLEDPRASISSPLSRPPPMSLGPIAPHWQPRVGYGGTYDGDWAEQRMPLVPTDLDDRYYHCVPEEQHVPGFLRGGETVKVVGMTPDAPLVFELPYLRLGFRTFFTKDSRAHVGCLHTVIIQPNERRVSLVIHSTLLCQGREHQLEDTVVFVKDRLDLRRA